MEKIYLDNADIEVIMPQKVLHVNFYGDIADDDYKEIWTLGFEKALELNIEKFIFDQSDVGKVGFTARGWVIIKILPRIRDELAPGLQIHVVSSKNMVSKTGVKYLVGMFKKMAGLNVSFYSDLESALANFKTD